MKKLTITVQNAASEVKQEAEVKSECAMWSFLRKLRDSLTDTDITAGIRAIVVDEAGAPFKDITFRKNSKGKIEMPNAVKETNRVKKPAGKKPIEKEEVAPSGATAAELSEVLTEAESL